MAEQLGIGFVIGATVGASVAPAFASVENKIKATSKAFRDASRQASTLHKALAAREAMLAARANVQATGGQDARALAELKKLSRAYVTARKDAKAYGQSVDEWRRKHAQAAASVESVSRRLDNLKKIQDERSRRQELRTQVMETVAPLASVVMPVKLAIDFESNLADVKKVTDFDDAGFAKFSNEILELSTRLPMAASGLTAIAAAAGQSGIAKEELVTFTEDAAKMGVAFDISAAEAGSAMTGLRNNFKLTQDGVRLLGDSMNALANSMDAKAADIVNFANRAGGTAKLYGMTGQEVAALGAAFLDAKVGAEQASTATNAMLVRLGTADKLPKDAQAAFKMLGLSGKGMAKAFKEDAQGALLMFLQTVAKSKDPMRALNAIFGAEHAPKIARLMNNLQHYGKALDTVSKQENYQGSMEDEYATRAKTTANNIQLLKNTIAKLGITIGTAVLPPLNTLLGIVAPIISSFADWAREHEGLTQAIMGVIGGLVTFKAVSLAMSYTASIFRSMGRGTIETLHSMGDGVQRVRGRLGTLRQSMTTTGGVMRNAIRNGATVAGAGLASLRGSVASTGRWFASLRGSLSRTGTALRNLNVASVATGAKLMASGAMATTAGAMAAASRTGWGILRGGIRMVGSAFRVAFGPIGLLMTALSFGVDYIMEHWDTIGPYFTKLWDGVKKIFDKAMEWLSPVFDTIGSAFDKLGEAWNWMFGDDEEKKVAVEPAKGAAVSSVSGAAVGSAFDRYSEAYNWGIGDDTGAKTTLEPVKISPAATAGQQPFVGPPKPSAAVQAKAQQAAVVPVRPEAPTKKQDFASQARQMAGTSGQANAPKMSTPVSVNMQFSVNGVPDQSFAQGVIRALRERSGELEGIISGIVHNQARLAYGA